MSLIWDDPAKPTRKMAPGREDDSRMAFARSLTVQALNGVDMMFYCGLVQDYVVRDFPAVESQTNCTFNENFLKFNKKICFRQ